MELTEAEDELFARWKEKRTPFVIDGAPFPDDYRKAKVKYVVVLKDANLGERNTDFDLRGQMMNEPDKWWRTIACWCYSLLHLESDLDWNDITSTSRSIQDALRHFAFMQLKKTPGGGSISDEDLSKIAQEDKKEIIEQLVIYSPDIIICGGVGDILTDILSCRSDPWKETKKGVRYREVNICKDKVSYLVAYCHPSVRAPKNIICYGLRDACFEIAKEYNL